MLSSLSNETLPFTRSRYGMFIWNHTFCLTLLYMTRYISKLMPKQSKKKKTLTTPEKTLKTRKCQKNEELGEGDVRQTVGGLGLSQGWGGRCILLRQRHSHQSRENWISLTVQIVFLSANQMYFYHFINCICINVSQDWGLRSVCLCAVVDDEDVKEENDDKEVVWGGQWWWAWWKWPLRLCADFGEFLMRL